MLLICYRPGIDKGEVPALHWHWEVGWYSALSISRGRFHWKSRVVIMPTLSSLPLWQPPGPSETTKLTSWQLSGFRVFLHGTHNIDTQKLTREVEIWGVYCELRDWSYNVLCLGLCFLYAIYLYTLSLYSRQTLSDLISLSGIWDLAKS